MTHALKKLDDKMSNLDYSTKPHVGYNCLGLMIDKQHLWQHTYQNSCSEHHKRCEKENKPYVKIV